MTYIPEALRRLVAERAGGRCEYCRLHEDDTFFTHEVEKQYAPPAYEQFQKRE